MKKLFYILAAVATLSMTSCSDLLEEDNYGNPTVEDMLANEENVVLLVGQCYADLKWIHDHWGYWGLVTISADEGLCVPRNKGNDWNDGGYWMQQNDHTWDFRGDAIKNIWDTTISGAVSCNLVLKNLELAKDILSPEVYAQYVGEVEVLRSYYFYLLFECFGRIPYTEVFEEVVGPMNTPELTWSYLVSCLERNAPNMTIVDNGNRAANYGRTSQGFAYALLARLYLNAESYGCNMTNVFPGNIFVDEIPELAANATKEEKEAHAKLRLLPARWDGSKNFYDLAVECCDMVISPKDADGKSVKSYSIEPDYFTNFKLFNESSKENIFVVVDNGMADFDERSKGDMSNKLRIVANTHHYGVQQAYGMILDTWNGFCARPEFLKLYNENDVRGMGTEKNGTGNQKQWGWFVGPVYKASATAEQKANRSVAAMYVDEDYKEPAIIRPGITESNGRPSDTHNLDGARLNKWEIDKTGTYKYSENDFVLMRYADVLWMKEEAILRGGNGQSGFATDPDFQTLKARSFAYGGSTFEEAYGAGLTLDLILDERGREFTWEMVRRRDLIRYDKFYDFQYVTKKDKFTKWYPIPRSVLQKSLIGDDGKRVWTQNEGYDTVK